MKQLCWDCGKGFLIYCSREFTYAPPEEYSEKNSIISEEGRVPRSWGRVVMGNLWGGVVGLKVLGVDSGKGTLDLWSLVIKPEEKMGGQRKAEYPFR